MAWFDDEQKKRKRNTTASNSTIQNVAKQVKRVKASPVKKTTMNTAQPQKQSIQNRTRARKPQVGTTDVSRDYGNTAWTRKRKEPEVGVTGDYTAPSFKVPESTSENLRKAAGEVKSFFTAVPEQPKTDSYKYLSPNPMTPQQHRQQVRDNMEDFAAFMNNVTPEQARTVDPTADYLNPYAQQTQANRVGQFINDTGANIGSGMDRFAGDVLYELGDTQAQSIMEGNEFARAMGFNTDGRYNAPNEAELYDRWRDSDLYNRVMQESGDLANNALAATQWGQLMQNLGYNIPAASVAALLGGAGAPAQIAAMGNMLPMAVGASGSALKEKLDEGYTLDQARRYAALNAINETLFQEAIDPFHTTFGMPMTLQNMLGEAVQEGAGQLVDPLMDLALREYNGVGDFANAFGQQFGQMFTPENLAAVGEAAKMGALGAGINAMAMNPVNTIRTARDDIQLGRNYLDRTNDYERFTKAMAAQQAFDEQMANESGDEIAKMSARSQDDRLIDIAREFSRELGSDSPLARQTARAANTDFLNRMGKRYGLDQSAIDNAIKISNEGGRRIEFANTVADQYGEEVNGRTLEDGTIVLNLNSDVMQNLASADSLESLERGLNQKDDTIRAADAERGREFARNSKNTKAKYGRREAELQRAIEAGRQAEAQREQEIKDTQRRYAGLGREAAREINRNRNEAMMADQSRAVREGDLTTLTKALGQMNNERQRSLPRNLRRAEITQNNDGWTIRIPGRNGAVQDVGTFSSKLNAQRAFDKIAEQGVPQFEIGDEWAEASQAKHSVIDERQNRANEAKEWITRLNEDGTWTIGIPDRDGVRGYREVGKFSSEELAQDAIDRIVDEGFPANGPIDNDFAFGRTNNNYQVFQNDDGTWSVAYPNAEAADGYDTIGNFSTEALARRGAQKYSIEGAPAGRQMNDIWATESLEETREWAEDAKADEEEARRLRRDAESQGVQPGTPEATLIDNTAAQINAEKKAIKRRSRKAKATQTAQAETTQEAVREAPQAESAQEQANTQTAEETAKTAQKQAEETKADRHVRGTAQRLMDSKYTSKTIRDWIKREIVKGNESVMRTTLHDSEMLQSAEDHFAGMTLTDALKEMQDLDAKGMGGFTERQKGQVEMNAAYLINKTNTALRQMATERENLRKAMKEMTPGSAEYQQAEQALKDSQELQADVRKQVEAISEITYKNLSEHAYALRTAQFLQNMSPEGKMRVVDRLIASMNNEVAKTRKGKEWAKTHSEGMIKISDELRDAYLAADTEEARQEVMKQIEQSIADQIPFSAKTAINSFRYTMMLFNPATHIRNIVGNALTNGMFKEADTVAFFIEKALRASGKVFENQLDMNDEQDQKLYSYARRLGQSANDAYAQMVEELGKGTTIDQRRAYFARQGYTGDYLDFLAEQQGEEANLKRNPRLQARFNMAYANQLKQAGATIDENGNVVGKNGQEINLKDIESRAYKQAKSQVFSNTDMRHSIAPGFGAETAKMRDAAKEYFEKNKVDRRTPKDAKYAIRNEISEHQHIYGNSAGGRALEWLSDTTTDLLNQEDAFFIKGRYIETMAQQMNAQGYTVGENGILVKDGKALTQQQSDAAMAEMSEYALSDAYKATYHDFNQTAKRLNDIKKDGGLAGLLLDAVMPFTTTPMNILERTKEFSPLGILKSVLEYKKIATGEITADEFINDLSRGLTGTGNMIMGMLLYHLGLLAVGNENPDKEKYYEEGMFGRQEYAINLPKWMTGGKDGTYTIDWAAPAAAVMLLGGQIAAAMDKDRELSLSDLIETSTSILDPIFVTTYLSSLNSALSSYQDNKIGGILMNAAQSYVNQFFPTFGSTFNKIVDETKRSTYSDNMLDRMGRQALNKIPFASFLLEPSINERGEVEKNQDLGMGMAGRALYSLSPGKLSISSADDIDTELKRLFDENGQMENKLLPTTFNKFSVDGENQKLKPQEYTKINQSYAQAFHKYAGDFMKSSYYQNMTDDERIDIMKELQDHATLEARMQYYKDMGLPASSLASDSYKASQLYTGIGGSLSGWYISQGIKSDKDAQGNTIKNSKALKTADFYRKEGTYDEILELIRSGKADPADFGLNKTVIGMSDAELSNYLEMLEDGSFTGSTYSSGRRRSRSSGGGSGRSSKKSDMDKLYEKLYNMAMSGTLDSIGDLASQIGRQAQMDYGPKSQTTNHEALINELEKMVSQQRNKPR